MKAKHSLWKNKLAKTMFFTTVILVAALFLGSAASGGVTHQISTQTQTKNNGCAAVALAPQKNMVSYKMSGPSSSPHITPGSSPRPMNSRGELIFDQGEFYPYTGPWVGYTSDATLGYLCYEDFWGLSGDIGGIVWYGLDFNWNTYVPGDPTGMTFEIKFYADNGGVPGAVQADYTNVAPTFVDTGTNYDGYGDVWGWTVSDFTTPVSGLAAGWVSVQSTYAPDGGAFLWVCGPNGNTNGEQNLGDIYNNFAYNLTAPSVHYPDDVGIAKIDAPASGAAATIIPTVEARNYGNNSEYSVPIACTISKKVYTDYLTENFEGTFPPAGWTVQTLMGGSWRRNDFWSTPQPNGAGTGYCADADVEKEANYPMLTLLISPSFDLTGVAGAVLSFDSFEYLYGSDYAKVDVSTDSGATWTNVWQKTNSYIYGVHELVSVDLSAYGGDSNVMVRFNYWAPSYDMYWQVDNVKVRSYDWVVEYPTTYQYIDMPWNTTTTVTFPAWTPADMGLVENIDLEYKCDAQTFLAGDYYPNNDLKTKAFSLHYGYFDDVAVTAINSPVSGPAAEQIPEVAIANHGQHDENVNVNMIISKIVYGASWTTDGSGAWIQSQSNLAGGTPPEAELPYYSIVNNYAYLQSPGIDTSAMSTVTLSFRSMINSYAGGDYWCKVLIRAQDSDPWSDITPWSEPIQNSIPAAQYTIDVTAYKGPATSVQFEFTGNYFDLNYWYVDDFSIGTYSTDFSGTFPPMSYSLVQEYDNTSVVDIAAGTSMNVTLPVWHPEDLPVLMNIDYRADVTLTLNGLNTLGTYGFEDYVPPAGGWTMSPAGTWQQYNYYTPGIATPCAYLSYGSAPDWTDDTFTSQAVDTTGYSTLTLSFASYISWYANSDTYFYVEATADGVNWYDVTPWSNPATGSIGPGTYSVDITAYISTQTQVRFRFYGYAFDFNEWYIDDVSFGPYSTDFSGSFPPGGSPGYLPGWTEQDVGASPQFYTVGTVTSQYPYCSPHSGNYMEEYNSYMIPTGDTAMLIYNTPLNLQSLGYTNLALKFWMYWYYGFDYLNVEASTDGVNWNTVGVFYDTYGPQSFVWTQQSVDLSAYANDPVVYLAFSGYSSWYYNMFFDDISIVGYGVISDGNPGDNTMSKFVTLSYEHDVGVALITQPTPPVKDEAYLKYDNGVYANAFGSTTGEIYAANRFTTDETHSYLGWTLDTIMWNHYDNTAVSGTIKIFGAGTTTQPGALLDSEPFSVSGAGWFNITLANPVTIPDGDIWLCTDLPNTLGQHPDTCSSPGITMKTAWFSADGTTWYDLPSLGYDVAFMLRGHVTSPTQGGPWLPGTYPVSALVKNYGFTYTESNIPVEAKLTHTDNSTVVYDHFATVPGPLAPGETATVNFPDFNLANLTAWEGKYKLEIMTELAGDAHSSNDKKTLTFTMGIKDVLPPITTHNITGTMGLGGWYVSNVVVTLSAYDPAPPLNNPPLPPSGVNHTYYSWDNHTFHLYTTPVIVNASGVYSLYYYSDDHAGNVEKVKGPFAFKMDKTAPTINLTVTKQGSKWLLTATAADATSGIAKVEFYVDDVLVNTTTATPYTYLYKGKGKVAQAIAYDKAGNSAMSAQVNDLVLDSQQQLLNPNAIMQGQLSVQQQILLQK